MAQFSYESYAAQQATRTQGSGEGRSTNTQFLGEFLRNDGDVAVVRFPYHSMSDIMLSTTHTVQYPGRKFGAKVSCVGANCPLCAQGSKLDFRFFVKCLVYVIDEATSQVKIVPAIWDRPAAFADIDIKNLMQEYGDISQYLFKVKKNGSGQNTRYTMTIITNNTVYNPEIYKADFSDLEKIDPTKILTKTYEQYVTAISGGVEVPVAPVAPAAEPVQQPAYQQPVYQQPVAPAAPQAQTWSAPADTTAQPVRTQTHYKF